MSNILHLVFLVYCCAVAASSVKAAPNKSKYTSGYKFTIPTQKRMHKFDPFLHPPFKHILTSRYNFNNGAAASPVSKYSSYKPRLCIRRDDKYSSRAGCNFLYVVLTNPPFYRILAESMAIYRVILDSNLF